MLLHITRIDICQALHLRHFVCVPTSISTAQVLEAQACPWQRLQLAGLAQLEVSEQVERGMRLQTAKLSANICGLPPALPPGPYCMKLSTACGQMMLMGSALPPHPLVSFELQVAAQASGQTVASLAAQITAPHAIFFFHPSLLNKK